jgi:hypothetical protein
MPNQLIKANDLPVSARATVLDNENKAVLCVKTTFAEIKAEMVDRAKGIISDHITVSAGKTVSVKGEYKTAIDAYTGKAVDMVTQNGYTQLTLPEINGFIMVVLKK